MLKKCFCIKLYLINLNILFWNVAFYFKNLTNSLRIYVSLNQMYIF